MNMQQIVILIMFIACLAALVVLGLRFYKTNHKNEFMSGNYKMNEWSVAMSAQADMSKWILMAIPGLATVSFLGARQAVWTALGLICGAILNWLLTARRIRCYAEVTDSTTLTDYLSKRFNDKNGSLRVLVAIITIIFFTIYAASMLSAGAVLVSYVFGMSYTLALFLGTAVVVAYTVLGGFIAISWKDLIKGIAMFFTLIILPLFLIKTITGNGDFRDYVSHSLGLFQTDEGFGFIQIISAFSWGLGFFGMPQILTKFMAIEDKKKIGKATTIASSWLAVVLLFAILLGMAAVYHFDFVISEGTLMNTNVQNLKSENILGYICMNLFSNPNFFTAIISGIFVIVIMISMLSTADTDLLVASTTFTNDIYKSKFKKTADENKVLSVTRITTIIIAVVALIIALNKDAKVLNLISYAWAGFGAAFGPVVLFSLYSKKITFKGAVSSIIVGLFTVIAFEKWISPAAANKGWTVLTIYELIPGFIFATIALFLVSILDGVKDENVEKEYNMMLELVKECDAIEVAVEEEKVEEDNVEK